MSESKPHLKTLEEIERECILGLVEVLRTEGVDGVRYALWDMTNWHADYDPCIWRSRAPRVFQHPSRVGVSTIQALGQCRVITGFVRFPQDRFC